MNAFNKYLAFSVGPHKQTKICTTSRKGVHLTVEIAEREVRIFSVVVTQLGDFSLMHFQRV